MSRISFPFVDHVLVCLFNLLLTLIEQLEDLIINTNNSFLTLAKEAMYFLKETERGENAITVAYRSGDFGNNYLSCNP